MVSNRASGGSYSSPYSTLKKNFMSKERLQTEGMQVIKHLTKFLAQIS